MPMLIAVVSEPVYVLSSPKRSMQRSRLRRISVEDIDINKYVNDKNANHIKLITI